MTDKKGELIARVKFWFGESEPIFDLKNYIVEYEANSNHMAVVYKREKA